MDSKDYRRWRFVSRALSVVGGVVFLIGLFSEGSASRTALFWAGGAAFFVGVAVAVIMLTCPVCGDRLPAAWLKECPHCGADLRDI